LAWIESHTILIRHRKIIELARELRLRRSYIMGHLHALWHAALEQAEDGDLSQWSDELIAEMSDYPGSAPQYVRLLQKYGFLDNKIIHDWLDYSGKYLETKYRSSNPQKIIDIWAKHNIEYGKAFGRQVKPGWALLRKSILDRDNNLCHYCKQPSDFMEVDHVIPVENGGTDEPTNLVACCRSCNRKKGVKPYQSQTKASPPNLTLPNLTNNNITSPKSYPQLQPSVPEKTEQTQPPQPQKVIFSNSLNTLKPKDKPKHYLTEQLFDVLWQLYPRKIGKTAAFKRCLSQIGNEIDYKDAIKATKNYLASTRGVKIEFIKHCSSFFNEFWKDWINYTENKNTLNSAPTVYYNPEPKIELTEEQRKEQSLKFQQLIGSLGGKVKI